MTRTERDRPAALAASEASQAKVKQENERASHTPGPWFTKREGFSTIYVEARIGGGWVQEIAACGPTANGSTEQDANARLIAAAPEMLAALKAIVDCAGPGAGPEIGLALDAIQKATGEPE